MVDINSFLSDLKETHYSLGDYVDFNKVKEHLESISIKLNQLNYLIGQEDIDAAVARLWDENPKVFSVLDILIAVRKKDKKKAIGRDGTVRLISDYFNSPQQVSEFLKDSGLADLFQAKQIKNLVDYVFGIEVGLDTNARKNRGGEIMERLVANLFTANGITFSSQVNSSLFPELHNALGADLKRFDFHIATGNKQYLIEVNFYTAGGSKLNEVARAYSELAPKINSVPGFEFVWITDGTGWESARNKLEEAFAHIPSVYNLTTIFDFIQLIKENQ